MPSERQREANRRNGRRGGPKTEAGKERSRLNSIKHGLTSSTLVVLPEEDSHEYEEVLRGFRESFQPQGSVEDALVLRLAQAHWRSLRSRRVETGILHTTASVQRGRARQLVEDCPEHLNLHNAIGVGFMTMPPEHWQMYLRYDTTISRDFFRTLDALTRLQQARQRNKPPQKPVVAIAAGAPLVEQAFQPATSRFIGTYGPQTTPAELSDSGIRSVSQTSPAAPQYNERQEKTRKHRMARRTIPYPTVSRKERRLRRLLASARVLSRNAQRASQGNCRSRDRQRTEMRSEKAGLQRDKNQSRSIDASGGKPGRGGSVRGRFGAERNHLSLSSRAPRRAPRVALRGSGESYLTTANRHEIANPGF